MPKPERYRISSLPNLGKCDGAFLLDRGRPSSDKADTGSAAGRIVELHHKGHSFEECLRTVAHERADRFPQADLDEAQNLTRLYVVDPRHVGVVAPRYIEAEVIYRPDPTVEFVGHVDQLRRDSQGRLRVWDVKAGKPGGQQLIYQYAFQLACYALAATETLRETVLPGGIIRLRDYTGKTPGSGVLWETHWSLDDCRMFMGTVMAHLSELRAGRVWIHPGDHCLWCPGRHRGGPPHCTTLIGELLDAQ